MKRKYRIKEDPFGGYYIQVRWCFFWRSKAYRYLYSEAVDYLRTIDGTNNKQDRLNGLI